MSNTIQSFLGATTAKSKMDGSNAIDMPITDMTDPLSDPSPKYATMTRGGFTFSTVAWVGNLALKEFRSYRVELAHNTDPAIGYEVHFRGTPSTDGTGNVKMFIEYTLQKKQGIAIAGTTKFETLAIAAGGNTAGKEYYFSFFLAKSDIGLATMAKGDSLLINMCRLASDVADTYTGSMLLLEFGVHGAVDSTGENMGN